MINEAFWFFYWVDVAGGISTAGATAAIIAGLIGLIMLIGAGIEEDASIAKQALRYCLPVVVAGLILGIFTPPKEAFYAGAGQYIAQASEMDQTLISLKKLLDQKIEELSTE